MAFCRLVLPLLVLSVVQSYASVQVPVFLWGDLAKKSLKSNPLSMVSVEEFDGALKYELNDDPFTVIFIEETLSVEDFSRKNSDGDTAFPYLHANIGDARYLPAVENPLRALNKLADPEKVDHVKLTENGLSAEIEPESGKFLFINLKDAKEGESRSELLHRHNDFMEDMFTKLQERYDKVIAVYTAHYPSWTIPESHSRVRRQAEVSVNADMTFEGLLIYYNSMFLDHAGSQHVLSGITGHVTDLNETAGEMRTTLLFNNNNVTLNFYSKAGYWFFETITLEQKDVSETLHASNSEVFAPLGFCYRCAPGLVFSTVNETSRYTITISDLKIQPFFTNNATGLQFGDSYNCVGFFSAPIWACLFVVAILLSIMFYGIMMMMDIRTMDRFEDPKGKTININASE